MAKHKFSAENQPKNYRTRGPNKRTLLLNAIREAVTHPITGDAYVDNEAAEAGFYQLMVKRAMHTMDPQSGQLIKEIFARLAPVDKATLPLVQFPFREDGSASEKIEDIQSAVASGVLPADMGRMMVDMIVAGIKVFEVTEMAERLARIEEALNRGADD